MKAWKALEKAVAEELGGIRNVRVSYGESACDVIHPTLALECKYGLQIPKYLRVGSMTVYVVGNKKYIVAPFHTLVSGGLFLDYFKFTKLARLLNVRAAADLL